MFGPKRVKEQKLSLVFPNEICVMLLATLAMPSRQFTFPWFSGESGDWSTILDQLDSQNYSIGSPSPLPSPPPITTNYAAYIGQGELARSAVSGSIETQIAPLEIQIQVVANSQQEPEEQVAEVHSAAYSHVDNSINIGQSDVQYSAFIGKDENDNKTPYIYGVDKQEQLDVRDGWWGPSQGMSWQYQLLGRIDQEVRVDVFVVDLFDVTREIIMSIQQKGSKVICYFSAGLYEDWRTDFAGFPENLRGKPAQVWPGERWLDIRKDEIRPLMQQRLIDARNKRCEAVLIGHVDGYDQDTGFGLTEFDQIEYNTWLAEEAHSLNLGIGFISGKSLIKQLAGLYDFVVAEECKKNGDCEVFTHFHYYNKAVFNVEFPPDFSDDITYRQILEYCPDPSLEISSILKKLDLTSPRIPCP